MSSQHVFLNVPAKQRRLRIGEAAKLLGLEPYVLRYWESEFPQLAPPRTEKGQRLYSEQDLETIRTIQTLLYDEGLTIEGARRRLDDTAQFRQLARGIVQELQSIREMLAAPKPAFHGQEHPSSQEEQ
ncbi:MAG TPA: MerR family transcriptional regulator [Desulfonatronum sp.]|nr:MerR family transcriptional regulator [Desulfonatronum sp.]